MQLNEKGGSVGREEGDRMVDEGGGEIADIMGMSME